MQMDVGMDTGAMLLQGSMAIGEHETTAELTPRLAELGASLLIETLVRLERGDITPIQQNDVEASHAPILKREDGQVDWAKSAMEIFNRQRGFTPFPGCYTFLDGARIELISIAAETSTEDSSMMPGTICEVGKDNFAVVCGGGSRLRITQLQPAGKRPMVARDFLNGAKLQVGTRFESGKTGAEQS
jgi:methionyl-tRNA formyltransferase